MSNYTVTTDFGAKDALTTGDPNKVIRGSDFTTEFNSIATAVSSKADTLSPTFTGVPAAPTASSTTDSTQIATTAYVRDVVDIVMPIGSLLDWSGNAVPTVAGGIEFKACDGSAIIRANYTALHTILKDVGGVNAYGWGAGDGSTTFNLPDLRGRVRVGTGTGTIGVSGGDADVDTGADTLTVPTNATKWITGMQVTLSFTSGSITGAGPGTYYIIRNSTTTVKLATSLANAQNGTAVDFTAKATPVWTLTHTLTARTIAEVGGEEAHAMTITELLAHTHTGGLGGGLSLPVGGTVQVANTGSTGGNVAMNIMQSFAVLIPLIRVL